MLRHLNKYYQKDYVFDFTHAFKRANGISLAICLVIALIGFLKPAQTAHLIALTALCAALINLDFLLAKSLSDYFVKTKHVHFAKFFTIWDTILDIEIIMLIDLIICIFCIMLTWRQWFLRLKKKTGRNFSVLLLCPIKPSKPFKLVYVYLY